MIEENPFGSKHPDWLEEYKPLVRLKELTGDQEIPNKVKIAYFIDRNLDEEDENATNILSLGLKSGDKYSAELSISRYPDGEIRLDYTKSGDTKSLGEVETEKKRKYNNRISKF